MKRPPALRTTATKVGSAGRLVAVAAYFALLACAPVGEAPPSTKSVAVTPASLAAIFTRECLAQADVDWVRRRSSQLRAACGPLDNGDCASNADGYVQWFIPTKAGPSIRVTMLWGDRPTARPGPPVGELGCSLAVDESQGALLRQSVARLGQTTNAPPRFHFIGATPEAAWLLRRNGRIASLELYHYVQASDFGAMLSATDPNQSKSVRQQLVHVQRDLARYPWVLQYSSQ